jgi:hypothetical protein
MSVTTDKPGAATIQPFHVDVATADLEVRAAFRPVRES